MTGGMLVLERITASTAVAKEIAWATVTEYRRLGAQRLAVIFSQFWRLQIQDQGADRAISSLLGVQMVLSLAASFRHTHYSWCLFLFV